MTLEEANEKLYKEVGFKNVNIKLIGENISCSRTSIYKPYLDAVNAELKDKGLSEDSISKLQPILNLSGKTNTDLKMEYGPANLPFLTECDNNFINFCHIFKFLFRNLCITPDCNYYRFFIFIFESS